MSKFPPHLVVIINFWVGPAIGCKGELIAVLYDWSAGDMEKELRGGGGMDT